MGWFSDIFGGGSNAPQAAMGYYNQIPGLLKQYLSPYSSAGQQMLPMYQQMMQNMMQNPVGFTNSIMSQYQQSPQYKDAAEAATTAANNAGAAGGTLGTGAEQSALMGKVNQLQNADQQQFLQNAMQPFTMGMSGANSLINNGMNASSLLAQQLAQNLRDQGGLAYQQAEDQDRGLMGAISGIGSLFGL